MSDAAATTMTEWRPRANPWLIALPVMLATFMGVLDTSIVVVALPYIAGNLGATQDQSTWVLTSYLVANAVILPASAWFSSFLGRKRFLVAATALFTLASLTCGIATSMPILVISRILQGLGGGAMQPLSQAILLESFPPTQRGTATALFGLGIVVAPVVGPTLGGWLTDQFSWRWTFFINLPVGILAVFLMLLVVEDPPYIRASRPGRIDGIGFGLMGLFLGTLQIILDKGQDADWFSAVWLRWFAVICAACFIGFIVRELRTDHPIVDLRIFKNRNFAVSSALFALFGVALYALIALQPLFLQSLLGYTAFDAGLSVTPRGIGSLVAVFVVGALVSRVNPKMLVGVGFRLAGARQLSVKPVGFANEPVQHRPAQYHRGSGLALCLCAFDDAGHRHVAQRTNRQCHRPPQSGSQHRRQCRPFLRFHHAATLRPGAPGHDGRTTVASEPSISNNTWVLRNSCCNCTSIRPTPWRGRATSFITRCSNNPPIGRS